jgi:CO/xanthine dehydrogenase Mo-binding subunit
MNANTDIALSRRTVLQGTGALVVAFSMGGSTEVLAQAPNAMGATGGPKLHPTDLDSWLSIGRDGKVTLFFGKIDGGQGTDLAMGQIVADELDVPMSSINIVQGDSVLTINQGGASGSTGVRFAGAAFRQAGAEARRVLINRAAARLGVPADRLAVNDGVVSVAGDASKKISYADLVGGQRFDSKIGWNDEYGNALALTSPAKPKTHDQYKIVGTPQKRMDVAGKVFGTKPWVGDIRVEGMVHGRMIRPPVAGASVVSVDESSIAHIPGAQVVRKGDFIGVVAPKEWNAIKAAQVLRVTWSDAKAPFVEMNDLYTHIRNAPATNRAGADRGEVDGAFARAARVITAEYEFPFQSHASMGPGVAVADVRPEGVKVWTGTQKPHFAASGVAGCLGIAPEKVHAVWVAGAGCYGRNDAGDVTMDAAVMSQIVGKPVRVQYMRHEGTGWDPKAPASIHRARAALDENGNLIAFDFYSKGFSRLETNSSEGRAGDTLAGMLTGQQGARQQAFNNPENAYTFANRRLSWETIGPLLAGASPLRTSHLRDPLGPQIHFASESFVDEIAFAVKADPVEFRIKHLSQARDIAAIKAVAERAGWKYGPHGTRRTRRGDIATGQGIAYARRNGTIVALVADVEVNTRTGAVRVPKITCAHDCGLIVNPETLKLTLEASIVQGLSRAIHEEVRFDSRNVTSVDWLTYPIVDIQEAPQVDIVLINHPELESTGAGESAMRPLVGAVANAVFEATGKRLRRAPVNPANILRSI